MKRYAIVTGGTKGIGRGIVEMLLERGFHVIASYHSDEEAKEQMYSDLEIFRGQLFCYSVDHADLTATLEFVRSVKNLVPQVDCLVLNAGKTIRKPFNHISVEEWTTVLNVNLNSHFIIVKELFGMIVPGARLICIGSAMGVYPHATSLPYGVGKAALHAMAQNLVKEFEGTDTTVNVVVPGFVETQWQRDKPIEIRNNIYEKTAIKRFATVEEIIGACVFCMDNSFVNGALIEVNGGYCFK